MASDLQMSPQLEQIHGEIRDNFRAIANGFQRLDKVKDSNRQSKQLEELTGKMRECKRMPESKAVIGLLWEPKLPVLPSRTKNGSDSKSRSLPETGTVWKPNSELIDGLFVPPNNPKKLNKFLIKQVKDTTGKSWFDMPAATITPELKKDLQLLKLRSAIDPKRHYKKGDSKSKTLPKYFQVGTVIESASDFFSGRLTKKERKVTLADELLSDNSLGEYRKRKVREIEDENRPAGNEKWKIRGGQSWKRAKQRRN